MASFLAILLQAAPGDFPVQPANALEPLQLHSRLIDP
jgi:hypothetical protein